MYMPVIGAPLLIEERKGEEGKKRKNGKKTTTVKLRGFIEVFLTLKAPQRTVRRCRLSKRLGKRRRERERERERERRWSGS